MKTYVCLNCGVEVRRPTPPLSCQACRQQRIGLFKEKPAGAAAPPAPGASPPPAPVPPAFTPPPPPGPVMPQYAPQPAAPSASVPGWAAPAPPAAPYAPTPAAVTPPQPYHAPPAPLYQAPATPSAPAQPYQPPAPPVSPAPAYQPPPAPVQPVAPAAPPVYQPPPAAPPPAPPVPAPAPVTYQPPPPSAPAPAPVLPAVPPTSVPPRPGPAAHALQPAAPPTYRPPVPTVPAFRAPDEEPAAGIGLDEPREALPDFGEVPQGPAVPAEPRPRRPIPRPGADAAPPPPAALYAEPAAPVEPDYAALPTPPARPVAPPPAAVQVPSPRPAPPPPAPVEPAEDHAAKAKAVGDRRVPGTIMWQYPKQIPGQAYSTAPIRCCPVVFGKNQFAACIGKVLVGLDWKSSGLEKLWECDTDGHIPGSPVLGSDSLMRVHSGDGWLHCIDQNGGRVWEPVPVGEPLGWASPLVDGNGNTYISGYGGGIFKVSPRGDFRNVPYFRSRQKFDSTGLIYRGVLYIGCEDAFVYAIQLSDTTGKNVWDHLAARGKTEWFINSGIALAPDSTIVVAGRDEYLYGFNQDGKALWKVHIPGQMLASPVIAANGDVIVGISLLKGTQTDQGKVICVDGEHHRVRWEYEAKGAVESTPVIGDDEVIYFGDNSGHIHALKLDGQVLWRQNVKMPVRSAGIIAGANRLVFGLDNGTLVGLLCTSAAVATRGWPKFLAK